VSGLSKPDTEIPSWSPPDPSLIFNGGGR